MDYVLIILHMMGLQHSSCLRTHHYRLLHIMMIAQPWSIVATSVSLETGHALDKRVISGSVVVGTPCTMVQTTR